MKQFKCSMNKKIESLAKKSEGVGGEEAYLDFEDAVKLVLMDKYGVVDSHGPSDETANSLVLQYGATLRDAFNKGGNGGYSPESEALYIITDRLHEAPHFFDDCKNFKFKAGESKKRFCSMSKKAEKFKDRVTLYTTTRFDEATVVKEFLEDISGGNVAVAADRRGGDSIYVYVSPLDGDEDAFEAFIAIYADNFKDFTDKCDVDLMGWTDPVDLKYFKSESKKSEGISDMIDAKIDYNMFMRMCKTAAYLEEDEDYWDALWDFYSEVGSIGDALVFFDNLFQYTSWKTAKDLWTDYSNILGDKPEGKDYEEALDAYLDENDNEVGKSAVYKYGNHYLMLH